jgi:hypothetical protein
MLVPLWPYTWHARVLFIRKFYPGNEPGHQLGGRKVSVGLRPKKIQIPHDQVVPTNTSRLFPSQSHSSKPNDVLFHTLESSKVVLSCVSRSQHRHSDRVPGSINTIALLSITTPSIRAMEGFVAYLTSHLFHHRDLSAIVCFQWEN